MTQEKQPITEDQARILLEQAKMETEQNMKGGAGKKWKKFLAVMILIAILIAVFGVVGPMAVRKMGE